MPCSRSGIEAGPPPRRWPRRDRPARARRWIEALRDAEAERELLVVPRRSHRDRNGLAADPDLERLLDGDEVALVSPAGKPERVDAASRIRRRLGRLAAHAASVLSARLRPTLCLVADALERRRHGRLPGACDRRAPQPPELPEIGAELAPYPSSVSSSDLARARRSRRRVACKPRTRRSGRRSEARSGRSRRSSRRGPVGAGVSARRERSRRPARVPRPSRAAARGARPRYGVRDDGEDDVARSGDATAMARAVGTDDRRRDRRTASRGRRAPRRGSERPPPRRASGSSRFVLHAGHPPPRRRLAGYLLGTVPRPTSCRAPHDGRPCEPARDGKP